MRLVRFSLALALLVLFSGAVFAQDKTGAIKGKVRVEKGSASGVSVILRQGDQEITRATTGKNGEFQIGRIPPGTYAVDFRKPGLSVGTVDGVQVQAGKTRTLGDRLILSVDEGSIAFIRGSVFSESGRSIPGIKVELAKILDANSTQRLDYRVTGETGEFVFRLPPEAAKYRLTIRANGAAPAEKDVEVDGAAVYRIALTLKPIPK